MLRLFAALPLDDAAADRVESVQRGLPGRLARRESLHVTLAFFGAVDGARAADLHAALGAISAPAFAFWLDGVGAFGGDRPRLIYAAVRPDPALTLLHEKVAQAARGAGVAVEAARYVPHVTLARPGRGEITAAGAARALAARAAFLAGPVAAEAFALYRSDPGAGGPVHTGLARYPLR